MTKLHFGLGLVATGLLAWACSTNGDSNMNPGGPGAGGTSDVSLGSGGDVSLGTGTGPDSSLNQPTPDGGTVTFRRKAICDANNVCKCTTFASLGATAKYGSGNDSTTDFELWLEEKSNLATVDFFKTDTPITPEFLAAYDVILLQDLRGWALDAAELQAFQDWIAGGGGVIALSGYFSDDASEIVPTNSLLSATGLQLLAAEVPGQTCVAAESIAVCSNTNSNNGQKCYCWGVSVPVTEFDPAHPINANLRAVGAFRGRAVNPGDGQVVLSYQGTPVGATKTVGLGKVFVFGDEWITYTSQWGEYKVETAALNQKFVTSPDSIKYESCWDEAGQAACTARHVFQTMQFWYNSILYVAPPSECNFVIDEPDDIIY